MVRYLQDEKGKGKTGREQAFPTFPKLHFYECLLILCLKMAFDIAYCTNFGKHNRHILLQHKVLDWA